MVKMFVFFMMLVLALLLYCNRLMDMLLEERRLRMGYGPFDEEGTALPEESNQNTGNGKCTTSC